MTAVIHSNCCLSSLRFNLMFNQPPHVWMDVGFMFIYYGVYFGVLGRDTAELCADKMAANIGVRQGRCNEIHFESKMLVKEQNARFSEA